MRNIVSLLILFFLSSSAFAEQPNLKPQHEYQTNSKEICHQKWNKRGELDQRMYQYCYEQQMEGYRKLKHLHQYADQKFYSEVSYPYCTQKWTKRGVSNPRMISYCLEQEVEGIKDVMYYREQYGEDKVNKIANKAIYQFNSWNMAAYKVKQHFDR